MRNSSLYDLFYGLSGREKSGFVDYLRSPLFNKSDKLLAFGAFLIKREKEEVVNQDAYRAMYGPAAYNDLIMRQQMTKLMGLLEDYISLRQFQSDPLRKIKYQMNVARRLNSDKQFRKLHRKSQVVLDKEINLDAEHYQKRFEIEETYNQFLTEGKTRTSKNNLQNTVDSLDEFYLFNKLKYCCVILNDRNVVATDYQLFLLDEILSHLKHRDYAHNPGIRIYYTILKMLSEENSEMYFENLVNLLDVNRGKLANDELRLMYVSAQNYCIKKANSGHRNYLEKLFDLYVIVVDNGIVYENDSLSPWTFKNMVTVGLQLKEYGWVEKFISESESKLPDIHRQNAIVYNRANLHFHLGEFSQVLKLLQQVEYNDLFYGLGSRLILMKTFYELRDIESLYSLVDSFRVFLRKNKLISDNHRTAYLNLLKLIKKLTNTDSYDTARLRKLKEEITGATNLPDAQWLMAQIKVLDD